MYYQVIHFLPFGSPYDTRNTEYMFKLITLRILTHNIIVTITRIVHTKCSKDSYTLVHFVNQPHA